LKIAVYGGLNAEILGRQILYYTDCQWTRFLRPKRCDVGIFIGYHTVETIKTIQQLHSPRRKIIMLQGSDWFAMTPKCKQMISQFPVIRVSKNIGLDEYPVFPIPVDTRIFYNFNQRRTKDVLYYCPDDEIYCRDFIDDYIEKHPDDSVTILTGDTKYADMPSVYNVHKTYIRMTTRDAAPKMPYEALLCGCQVWWNRKRVTEIPSEMKMENTIPKLLSFLKEVST